MIDIICPICQEPMQSNSGNSNIYYCQKKEFNGYQCVNYLSAQKKVEFQIIEIYPYAFHLADYPNKKSTQIYNVPNFKLLLAFPFIVNFPWHNPDQTLLKLQTYLIFQ